MTPAQSAVVHTDQTACPVEQAVLLWAQTFAEKTLVLGYSGGMDSTVLLDILVRLGYRPVLVHVHHGLQAIADEWVTFAQQQAKYYQLPLSVRYVTLSDKRRQGIEAKARTARYQALWHEVAEQGILLTAHHQRDQAETVLLRLLRGTGVAGLGAMRAAIDYSLQRQHIRPLLNVAYTDLEKYAQRHQLQWVEDPTNHQTIASRNKLRLDVLPKLRQWQAQSEYLIAQTALHCQEADELLQQMAQEDQQRLAISDYAWRLPAWQQLSWSRAKHVLMHAMRKYHVYYTQAQWQQIEQQFYRYHCAQSHPSLCTQGYCLLVGDARFYQIPHSWLFVSPLSVSILPKQSVTLKWSPWLTLSYQNHHERPQTLHIRMRSGGEQLRVQGRRLSLKKWLQQQLVPHWQMALWPVMFDAQSQCLGWAGLPSVHWETHGCQLTISDWFTE